MFKGLTKLGKFVLFNIIYFNDDIGAASRSSNTIAVRLKLQPIKYVGEESDLVNGALFLANGIIAARKYIVAVRHILQV